MRPAVRASAWKAVISELSRYEHIRIYVTNIGMLGVGATPSNTIRVTLDYSSEARHDRQR